MAIARLMVQANGYTALSFRDIAGAVGVKSSSVHYHFPTKGSLGAELARRYTQEMNDYLEQALTESLDAGAFMARYTDVFRAALANENRMCMCGIMAAEHDELPPEVQHEVARFSEINVLWLARALALFRKEEPTAKLQSHALAIYAAVEGAQLVARSRSDIKVYDQTIDAFRAGGLLP
ncbi:TetR/AcrR family transcriptional regulator [Sodalis sp. dw_96]|uniref:TetR/AcrR family transcriptional regulator n=1 Tax=Sodalis sp. dw_96 TaxID=2719794 RepID=UPI001BD62892|nr:TetR/AcrR family transcriptional regulator [Sodalis sp. dw_96]